VEESVEKILRLRDIANPTIPKDRHFPVVHLTVEGREVRIVEEFDLDADVGKLLPNDFVFALDNL
jgi:hypothetical protein